MRQLLGRRAARHPLASDQTPRELADRRQGPRPVLEEDRVESGPRRHAGVFESPVLQLLDLVPERLQVAPGPLQPYRQGVLDALPGHRRPIARRSPRRLVDRMDLDALRLDVPGERQLLLHVLAPVSLGPDHHVVVDAVGVVVAVDQVPRFPYGVRGASDEHQDVDVARRSGVAPGLRAVHHESFKQPAGRCLQSFEVALEPQPLVRFERRPVRGLCRRAFALGGVACSAHGASPCPAILPLCGQPFAQAMRRSVVAFPPKGARSRRRASLLKSAMGISRYPICSTQTLIRRSSTDVFRWT